jgi:predicted transcriptional regulator
MFIGFFCATILLTPEAFLVRFKLLGVWYVRRCQKNMTTYRIVEEATSDQYKAVTAHNALTQFVRYYDTAEMSNGDSFSVRVYEGEKLDELCAVATVTANGKGGVAGWTMEER